MQINSIVQTVDGDLGLIIGRAPEPECVDAAEFVPETGPEWMVRIRGLDRRFPASALTEVASEELDEIVRLYIIQQYREYQSTEISAAFNVVIEARAYASSRDGLPLEFKCGTYENTVKTGSLATSVSIWISREQVNRVLEPKALLA